MLKAAARKPTNLARVGNVQQDPTESPAAFLERLMGKPLDSRPMDPEAEGSQAALIMHFVNQVAPDIRKKLQKWNAWGEKNIRICNSGRKGLQHPRNPEKQTWQTRQTRNTTLILSLQRFLTRKRRERQLPPANH